MAKFQCVDELVRTLQPVDPVYCFRKNSLKLASDPFLIPPQMMICGEMGCQYDRPISSLLRPCERDFILCTLFLNGFFVCKP